MQKNHIKMASIVMLKPEGIAVVIDCVKKKQLIRDNPGIPVLHNAFQQRTVSRIIHKPDIHQNNTP